MVKNLIRRQIHHRMVIRQLHQHHLDSWNNPGKIVLISDFLACTRVPPLQGKNHPSEVTRRTDKYLPRFRRYFAETAYRRAENIGSAMTLIPESELTARSRQKQDRYDVTAQMRRMLSGVIPLSTAMEENIVPFGAQTLKEPTHLVTSLGLLFYSWSRAVNLNGLIWTSSLKGQDRCTARFLRAVNHLDDYSSHVQSEINFRSRGGPPGASGKWERALTPAHPSR